LTPIYYDEDHRRIPTTEFPFDEVGRALGDLDVEGDAVSRVIEAFTSIPTHLLAMAFEGLPVPETGRARASRHRTIAMRIIGLRYILGCPTMHGKTVKDIAESEAFYYTDLALSVAWARNAIGAHKMLRNLTGTGAS